MNKCKGCIWNIDLCGYEQVVCSVCFDNSEYHKRPWHWYLKFWKIKWIKEEK